MCELPDPTGATPPLDEAEQGRMRGVPGRRWRRTASSGLIITSRTPEAWLGEVRRVALGGLTPREAAEMAEDVLRPYPAARSAAAGASVRGAAGMARRPSAESAAAAAAAGEGICRRSLLARR